MDRRISRAAAVGLGVIGAFVVVYRPMPAPYDEETLERFATEVKPHIA